MAVVPAMQNKALNFLEQMRSIPSSRNVLQLDRRWGCQTNQHAAAIPLRQMTLWRTHGHADEVKRRSGPLKILQFWHYYWHSNLESIAR